MNIENVWSVLQLSMATYPEKLALWAKDSSFTYRELGEKIARYASYLQAQGVVPGDHVAVLLPRESTLLISILAIFAVGAVYVPLNQRNPMLRNQAILVDSQCNYLISDEHYPEIHCLLPYSAELILGEETRSLFSSQPSELAYIIHTSGSTGKPKGVMISHANVLSMIHWAVQEFDVDVLSYTLASTAICFDLSIFEMFVPLCVGGCVVLVENALTLIDQDLKLPLSLINTVPSAARALIAHHCIPDSVQVINLAGEALEQCLVDEVYDTTHVKRVYNLYGPSETTTYSTFYLAQPHRASIMVPIGQPILGTKLYLLDQHQLPTPLLARGELYIAGAGVTLGYCHNENETNLRYVTLDIDGEMVRAYRTGDLARLNHDHEYEYLGRLDHQIKIHGFRVELDEIINALQCHPCIKQAFVIMQAVEDESVLVGYVVLHADHETHVDEIRQWLLQRLPDYMVPQYVMVLETLPLNANGKIDRAALKNPQDFCTIKTSSLPYQSMLEQEIAALWQTLLMDASLHRDANFFYHGGHSLLAARLLAKLNAQYHIGCSLEELFRFPTIATQAQLVREAWGADQNPRAWTMAERPALIPLSYGQERLWYLQYAQKNTPISNVPIVVSIQGCIDQRALTSALHDIVKRHEILRTVYVMHESQIIQQVRDDFSIHLAVDDVNEKETLQAKLAHEANKAFDLSCDLMIRVALFRMSTDESVLMITQHHIASDAWSLNILIHELSVLYNAYHKNTILPALPIPTQYADYSCWQRSTTYARTIETDLLYWKEKLAHAPDTIALPYDRKRGELQTYHGAFYAWDVHASLVKKLKKVAHENECTLFMLLLTAFDVLLYRYSQQEDFCVGILSANRTVDEVSHTLGFFVNSLVTRHHVQPDMLSQALLLQVRDTVLGSLKHQQLPFERLVEELQGARQLNRHPFFQVLFSLQNALDTDLAFDDLTLNVSEFDRKISKFDLTVSLVERNDTLAAMMEYNTDLFDVATIEQMTRHFIVILTSLSENLSQSIADIPLLTLEERYDTLTVFNQTQKALPEPWSLDAFFERVVAAHGDKLALISHDERLTYQALHQRANQLANLLVSYGVQKNVPVGLLLTRSVDAIVSMLAVTKAGGYYVPMDPAWPIERLNFVIQDAAIHLLMTQSAIADHVPFSSMLFPIYLDEAEMMLAACASTFESVVLDLDTPCYVMYTSGSTGQPKGVVATHAGVIRLVHDVNYVTLDETQSILQVSPLAFDGSTFDIWGSLLHGGTLVLMPDGIPELSKLSQHLIDYNITTLFVTTQLFNGLVDYKLEAMASLKQILFGGEVASVDHVVRFKRRYSSCALSNIYGPTECTTYALSYRILDDFDHSKPLPLGRPITNTCAVILSPQLDVCPKNVLGELYLGGLGLAKGYLNHPELTHEKFIDNPFDELPTQKLYKTGDVCFYRHDGQIVFVGRVDGQIKLRGHRIELSEIEQSLREIPDLLDAVVVVQHPEDYLIAYVISRVNVTLDLTAIKAKLAQHMPHYMLPDAIVCLDHYPLNRNGKVDKQQLPPWHAVVTARASSTDLGPVNEEIMRVIQDIWQDILELPYVGLQDNFFEVGGNSLKLILVLDRLQTHFQSHDDIIKKLDIVTLFQYPSLRHLAVHLTHTQEVNETFVPLVKRTNVRDKRKAARTSTASPEVM